MESSDYGPVPVSRIKAESAAIFEALSRGRRVLISRHGRVAAAIDPSDVVPPELLIDYVVPGEPKLPELTASEINQGSPSGAVTASVGGSPHYVTKDRQVYGIMREITADDLASELPTREQVFERERRIEDFLAQNPGADAKQLASLGETLNQELGIGHGGVGPIVFDNPEIQDLDPLLSQIEVMARQYAERAGELVTVSTGDATETVSLRDAIEARTVAAIARVTEETLSTVGIHAMKVRSVREETVTSARRRASEALSRLSRRAPA